MSSSIVSPFPFFTDTTGAPLEGGYIFIGQSNLNPETAPVNVFWDAALTIPAAQPVRTVGGYPSRQGTPSRFYSATDTYSITVRNKNRALVFSAFDQSDSPTSVFDISTQLITATAGQVTFALTVFTYLPGTDTMQVFRNGLRLNLGLDYLETNSSTITLTAPAALGDQFLFQGGAVITGDQTPGSAVSFIQSGTGAITRNMQDKARESVSVLDFGAIGNGLTNDSAAFTAAIASIPNGGVILVPNGVYLLVTEPTYTSSIYWDISPQATFIGNGTGYGKFPNCVSNIGNLAVGPLLISRSNENPYTVWTSGSPVAAGAINAFSAEITAEDDPFVSISFTGTLTNGSDQITNVSSTVGLRTYQAVQGGSLPAYPAALGTGLARIAQISGNIITLDKTYSGTTASGVSLTATYWNQKVGVYGGARGSSPSFDVNLWASNFVVEALTGSKGAYFGLEIDVISDSVDAITRGLLISGHGTQVADVALDIDRSGSSWFYGITMKNVSGDAIKVNRITDVSPTGNFLQFKNNADTTSLFNVDVLGNVGCNGFLIANGTVSSAAGLYVNNATGFIRLNNANNTVSYFDVGPSSIKLPVTHTAGTSRVYAGTFPVLDVSGAVRYVMCAV
jgi:hypothetical protein